MNDDWTREMARESSDERELRSLIVSKRRKATRAGNTCERGGFTKFGTAFINNLSGFRSVTGATTRTRFSGHSLVWITVTEPDPCTNDSRGIDGGRTTFTESRTRNKVSEHERFKEREIELEIGALY